MCAFPVFSNAPRNDSFDASEFTLCANISHLHQSVVSRPCYDGRMRYGSRALRFGAILLLSVEAVAAQQEPKRKDLPEAPVPKQEHAPRKHDNAFRTTVEVLGRRSVFFPDLAASPGPLDTKQKLELFADKSIAPSRLITSGIGSGIGQARNAFPGYGQGMSGYGKRRAARVHGWHKYRQGILADDFPESAHCENRSGLEPQFFSAGASANYSTILPALTLFSRVSRLA